MEYSDVMGGSKSGPVIQPLCEGYLRFTPYQSQYTDFGQLIHFKWLTMIESFESLAETYPYDEEEWGTVDSFCYCFRLE